MSAVVGPETGSALGGASGVLTGAVDSPAFGEGSGVPAVSAGGAATGAAGGTGGAGLGFGFFAVSNFPLANSITCP